MRLNIKFGNVNLTTGASTVGTTFKPLCRVLKLSNLAHLNEASCEYLLTILTSSGEESFFV